MRYVRSIVVVNVVNVVTLQRSETAALEAASRVACACVYSSDRCTTRGCQRMSVRFVDR